MRNNRNTRTVMTRVPPNDYPVAESGPWQREAALKQTDVILSVCSLVHITSVIKIPDENTLRCFTPPMTVPVAWVSNFVHSNSRFNTWTRKVTSIIRYLGIQLLLMQNAASVLRGPIALFQGRLDISLVGHLIRYTSS
jgi:hypothetical protein